MKRVTGPDTLDIAVRSGEMAARAGSAFCQSAMVGIRPSGLRM